MLLKCGARGLLRIPSTARRSNLLISKEINAKYSLEGLMLKLKLEYFGHLMRTTKLIGKDLMRERLKARGEGGSRECDG